MSQSFLEPTANLVMPMEVVTAELLVRQTVAKRLRMNLDDIQLETSFQDLNVDSLDLVELLFLLEDQTKKPIRIEETTGLVTVRDAVALVLQSQGK